MIKNNPYSYKSDCNLTILMSNLCYPKSVFVPFTSTCLISFLQFEKNVLNIFNIRLMLDSGIRPKSLRLKKVSKSDIMCQKVSSQKVSGHKVSGHSIWYNHYTEDYFNTTVSHQAIEIRVHNENITKFKFQKKLIHG